MLQQWHTAIQAGLRDKGQKMICHWHNCIPRSCVSVAPAFHRLLFTLHSSPDGKVILKTQKFIVATHRGNGSWGVGVGDGGGQRKREGPARLEWSRRVTLATLKDGASWAHPKKWCKHTVIAIHWVTFSSPGVVQPGSALSRVFISYLGKQEQTQLWFLSLASWQLSLRTQNYCRGTWHAVHTLSPCRKRKQLGAFTAPSIILLFFVVL